MRKKECRVQQFNRGEQRRVEKSQVELEKSRVEKVEYKIGIKNREITL